ncbi:hypothetical protein [Methylobacterium flocculans]|uniref:hypothetical protein n=1 Tax=Methylobacterium flocculans TaxID=2984843 RepID=UPI0021F355B8|nr:hypothetical protein [Methylobacterium sp. FF17]
MPDEIPFAPETAFARPRFYRAITRQEDGRIVSVREFSARSDAAAIEIVRKTPSPHPAELWGERGLVLRFRGREG